MNYEKRLYHLAEILEEDSLDALLIDDPLDLFYLTGFELSAGQLICTPRGNTLIVDGRYIEACSDFPYGKTVLHQHDILRDLLLDELKQVRSLAFISEKTSYQRFLELQKRVD
ncbi:MAG: aminopeptidase P family N-terminal domain-containing protein, partial [Chlamydiia bacterium]|nr:aminopeptidase P family N-terminal domain-containing protein [Chlamydiia bacterium]